MIMQRCFTSMSVLSHAFTFLEFQHLEEDLGPLSKEKENLLNEHKKLATKLNFEYEVEADNYRKNQQEVDSLLQMFSNIKGYVFLA